MDNEVLDKDRIKGLFRKLDSKMAARGLEANIYVVGGAAIALTINEERVTSDIDGVYININLDDAIREVGEEEGLSDHWMNGSVTSALTYFKKDDEPKTIFNGQCLSIQVASPDYVLAMKLAARRQKDIDDIVMLVEKLGIRNRKQLIAAVTRYFNADLSAAAWQRKQIDEFIDLIIEEHLLEFPDEGNDDARLGLP
jgi:hypothetical protein